MKGCWRLRAERDRAKEHFLDHAFGKGEIWCAREEPNSKRKEGRTKKRWKGWGGLIREFDLKELGLCFLVSPTKETIR